MSGFKVNFYENWETLDGDNTLAVRKDRKKMLDTYFSQFSFQENKDKEEEIPRDEFYQKSRAKLLAR